MNLWQQFCALFARERQVETCQQWDEARIQKMEKQMSDTVSRAQLDAAIQDLPDSVATATVNAILPLIQPAIDKMQASPDDFSAELTSLQGLGPAVGKAVGGAIAKVFAPVAAVPPVADAPPTGTPAAPVAP